MWEDILSTVGGFSTVEGYHDKCGGYLEYRGGYHDIPQNIPHVHHDIPHGTQGIPHIYHDIPQGNAHTLYRVKLQELYFGNFQMNLRQLFPNNIRHPSINSTNGTKYFSLKTIFQVKL